MGEIYDAGNLGLFTAVGVFAFPRYLDTVLGRASSKAMGLPITPRFRILNGGVKGAYIATAWLSLTASFSMLGIDIIAYEKGVLAGILPESARRTQEETDSREESVAEKYTKIGFLAGFPLAYPLFRDGWRLPMYHRITPHLLPLRLLPLYVGFACMSACATNNWSSLSHIWERQNRRAA